MGWGGERAGREERRERVVLVHDHWDAEPQLGSGRIAKSHKHTLPMTQNPEVTLFKQILIGYLLDVRLWAK